MVVIGGFWIISNEQYDYLKTHQTFAQLTREASDQLARHIRFRKIAKGQVIFYAQDPRDYFFVYNRDETTRIEGGFSSFCLKMY